MDIKSIHTEIEELLTLVVGWEQSDDISAIERDIALSKLSRLYETIRFATNSEVEPTEPTEVEESLKELQTEVAEPEVQVEISTEIEPESNVVDDSIFDIDIDGVSFADDEPKEEPKEEPDTETKEEPIEEPTVMIPEEVEEPATPEVAVEEQINEEPEMKPTENMLFDIDIIPKRSRKRRSVLMSLYDSSTEPMSNEQIMSSDSAPQSASKSAPELISEPEIEVVAPQTSNEPIYSDPIISDNPQQPIVGESFATNIETVADRLASINSTTTLLDSMTYSSLLELGINEQCQIARELFNDDMDLYRNVVATIESYDSYDDVMIYIAENFDWNEDNKSVSLILSILENKFKI